VTATPPGNSLDRDQHGTVVGRQGPLVDELVALLGRIATELDYNDAKGSAPFRLGMHDGLRFAEDALVEILRRHGHDVAASSRRLDA
jgi:hypothetical protein